MQMQKPKYLQFCAEASLHLRGLFSRVGVTLTELSTKCLSLGLNLSCGIRVTGFEANQPVIWGGWGGGCDWAAHPILPTLQWPFSWSGELESSGSTTITLERKEVEAASDFGSVSPPVSGMQQLQTSHQWIWAGNVVSPSQWKQICAGSISI